MKTLKITLLVSVALIGASSFAALAQAQKPAWGDGQKWGAGANIAASKSQLPETKLLEKNDQLFPGQSRTQAMRLEAEGGGINPQEDAKLKPMLKPITTIPPIGFKRTAAKSQRIHQIRKQNWNTSNVHAKNVPHTR